MMMHAFSLAELATAINGKIDPEVADTMATGFFTDTRKSGNGKIFVALSGDNFDGHNYLEAARHSGAVAAIVSENKVENIQDDEVSDLPLIVTQDSLLALGNAGAWNRNKFTRPVVAITGSAGKTTVKTLCKAAFSVLGESWATQGNLNNHIGAPLTLLGISEQHKSAVIELGASGLNEISYTAGLTRPDAAVITNVSGAHLEGFGSLENIVQAKGEIIDAVPESGTVVLNADDPYFLRWTERAGKRRIISFGLTSDADVYATDIESDRDGSRFTAVTESGSVTVNLPLTGVHNVANALSVIALSTAFSLDLNKVAERLSAAESVSGRLQWLKTPDNRNVIDDSYNASPASVKAAIDTLVLCGNGCLVLGDMAELGNESSAIHAEIGQYARTAGVTSMITLGEGSRHAAEAFGEGAVNCGSHDEVTDHIRKTITDDQIILVKGSRSAGMDRVVSALLGEEE